MDKPTQFPVINGPALRWKPATSHSNGMEGCDSWESPQSVCETVWSSTAAGRARSDTISASRRSFYDRVWSSLESDISEPSLPSLSRRRGTYTVSMEETLAFEELSDSGSDATDRDKPKSHFTNILLILFRFADRTSMQGVPYIRTSKSAGAKLIWSFLFVLCMSLLSLHLYYLFAVFYSYPKHSAIELGFSALSFPAVTFCNINPIRKSRLRATSDTLQNLVTRTEPTYIIKQMAAEYQATDRRKKRSPRDSDEDDDDDGRRRGRKKNTKGKPRTGRSTTTAPTQVTTQADLFSTLTGSLDVVDTTKASTTQSTRASSTSTSTTTEQTQSTRASSTSTSTTTEQTQSTRASSKSTTSTTAVRTRPTRASSKPTTSTTTIRTRPTRASSKPTTSTTTEQTQSTRASSTSTSTTTEQTQSTRASSKSTTSTTAVRTRPTRASSKPTTSTTTVRTRPTRASSKPTTSTTTERTRPTRASSTSTASTTTVRTRPTRASSKSTTSTTTEQTQSRASSTSTTSIPPPADPGPAADGGNSDRNRNQNQTNATNGHKQGGRTRTNNRKPTTTTTPNDKDTNHVVIDIESNASTTSTTTVRTQSSDSIPVSTTSTVLSADGQPRGNDKKSDRKQNKTNATNGNKQGGTTRTNNRKSTTTATPDDKDSDHVVIDIQRSDERDDTSDDKVNKGNDTGNKQGRPWNKVEKPYKKKDIEFINDLDLGVEFTNVEERRKLKKEEEKKQRKRQGDNQNQEEPFAEPSVSASIREEFLYLYSNIQPEQREAVGHQVEDMMVDCSFAGRRCHPQNFSLLSSTMFGNCFTIDHPGMVTIRGGYTGGLSLVVFLESDEYLRGVTTGTGIQVIIHPHDTMPFPEEDGMAIMAGTETNIALRRLNINRLGEPYGTCQEGEVFKQKYKHAYTRRACQHFCEHSAIMDRCNCYSEQSGQYVHDVLKRDLRPCRLENDIRCMLHVQYEFETGDVFCKCENPCSEQSYYKTVSMRQWPADEYTGILVETLCTQRGDAQCAKYRQADPRTIAQSFVKINIFYEDLNYENITEVEDYELVQFASDVGGTVGLWLGLSILSGFEVLQFLLEVFVYFLTFGPCRKKAKRPERPRRERGQPIRQHSVESATTDFSGY